MKNIVLCGMMGCGKTTMARRLEQSLGRKAVDTDDLVEKRCGMTISDLFAQKGEEAMREIETAVCRDLSEQEDLIIATGGGLPIRAENRELLRKKGVVVFLCRNPGETFDTGDMSHRPLAQQGRAAFLERFSQREPIYRAFAHIVIEDFSSPAATETEILKKLEGLL